MTGRRNKATVASYVNAPHESPGQPELDELWFRCPTFLAIRGNGAAFIDQGIDLTVGDNRVVGFCGGSAS